VILVASEEAASGLKPAVEQLRGANHILDAIEVGIRRLEVDSSINSVGIYGLPNALGRLELDAGIMDGGTLKSGAVGALTGYVHPISLAKYVLDLLPHDLLVGEGAGLFASELGLEKIENMASHIWSEPLSKNLWHRVCENLQSSLTGHDTVVMIGSDSRKNLGAGASTSGIAKKYPGRVGDGAVVGSGFYADNRVGAVACTGLGELTMRLAAAKTTIENIKRGLTVQEAVVETLLEMSQINDRISCGVTMLAIDKHENCFVGTLRAQSTKYFIWRDGLEQPLTMSPIRVV
jgi:beta-aspartyl-peptidase (threonine type)